MFQTTVTIQRPMNTTLTGADGRPATGLYVQADQMSPEEVIKYQPIYKWTGLYQFKITTKFWEAARLILNQDWLVDEQNLDPVTGFTYRYKVCGQPKNYPFSHQECYCDVFVGK